MNISGMLHRQNKPQKVRHIAELMAEAMGIDVTTW
jgi:Tat protein secretion system quality control protein TatD with DNase activity